MQSSPSYLLSFDCRIREKPTPNFRESTPASSSFAAAGSRRIPSVGIPCTSVVFNLPTCAARDLLNSRRHLLIGSDSPFLLPKVSSSIGSDSRFLLPKETNPSGERESRPSFFPVFSRQPREGVHYTANQRWMQRDGCSEIGHPTTSRSDTRQPPDYRIGFRYV